MAEVTKTCNSCFQPKPLSEFSHQKGTPDGLKYRCKTCDKRYYDSYYAKQSAHIMSTVRAWQQKNPDDVSRHKANYRRKQSQKKV
jgi:hypothetical protein